MSDEPKWLVVTRKSKDEPWKAFCHHISGVPYRYDDIDKAIVSMKGMYLRRWKSGNAKVIREDQFVV